MLSADLSLGEVLRFEAGGGVIQFAGQRAVLLDAVGLGALRRELVASVGVDAARGVLARAAFAQGFRGAEAMKRAFAWQSEVEWRSAGGRLPMLYGLAIVEGLMGAIDSAGGASWAWRDSFEVEQHRAQHTGPPVGPVCWALCGITSGYLSYCLGHDVYAVETQCAGAGEGRCRGVIKSHAAWGERATALAAYYGRAGAPAPAAARPGDGEPDDEQHGKGDEKGEGALVAKSAELRNVIAIAKRVAYADTTVLIAGEHGVGKERVARLIHANSGRAGGPLVIVDCTYDAGPRLGDRLFGHVDETGESPGAFERADGGTLYLEEVSAASPSTQVELLRALHDREVRRRGDDRPRKIDVRVLASTTLSLADEAAAGRFRHELLYQLRVIEIDVPPLRQRPDDLLALAHAALVRSARRRGRSVVGFSPAAVARMLAHRWPGNVPELENAVEHAVVVSADAIIEADALPDDVGPRPRTPGIVSDVLTLEQVERAHILNVLRANNGNRTNTAAQLKIGNATLYRKLKEYGVTGHAERGG